MFPGSFSCLSMNANQMKAWEYSVIDPPIQEKQKVTNKE